MDSSKAAVTDLINAVSHIDASLVEALTIMSQTPFIEWHLQTYDDETDEVRKLAKRLKAWCQLSAKVVKNDPAHMKDVCGIAAGVERVATVRNELAHGKLSYSDSAFGPLICTELKRPIYEVMPNLHSVDEKTSFQVIYREFHIGQLATCAHELARQITHSIVAARMIQKPSLRGSGPKPGGR